MKIFIANVLAFPQKRLFRVASAIKQYNNKTIKPFLTILTIQQLSITQKL